MLSFSEPQMDLQQTILKDKSLKTMNKNKFLAKENHWSLKIRFS